MARSAVNYTYEDTLKFRAPGSAAVTADTVASVPLDKLDAARVGSQRNTLGAEGYDVVIAVSVHTAANADEVYTFNVYAGASGDGASGTLVGSLTVDAVGQFVIKLDAKTIENLEADREELTLQTDVSGTAPSITYAAWMAASA